MLTVVHVDGSKRGQTESFDQPIVAVGRDPSNQLAFDPFKDTDVSTRHAQFMVQGGQLTIQDLNSRNGTFLNGQRVGSQPTPVPDGAVVQFGDKGPKVQISFRAAPVGPGKKTMMIQDLQAQVEATKAKAEQDKAAAKSSKFLTCFLFVLLLGGGVGAFLGYSWWSDRKKVQDELTQVTQKALPEAKKAAESAKAAEFAKAELAEAQKKEKEGDDAKAANKNKDAALAYAAAVVAYNDAARKAEKAESEAKIAALTKAQQELLSKINEKKKEQEQQTEVRAKELEQKKQDQAKEEQAKIEKLKAELETAKSVAALQPLIESALASKKLEQLESALAKVQTVAKATPNDQLTKWETDLKAKVEEAKSIPPKLDEVAKANKLKVVAIQATSYMLPKGQNERTTQIREFLTTASGTGFLYGKDKVITAKELVEPWKYDPAALALKKKWEETFGYQVSTRVDVCTLDTAGVYTSTSTTNPELEQPTAAVTYVGADAFADKPVDQTIRWKGNDTVVPVQPHKRDASNLAVIQLKGSNAGQTPGLGLGADEAAKPGALVVALGQRTGGPDVKSPDQARLYQQQGALTGSTSSPTLAVGAFSTWVGGPVLDPEGVVVGLIVDVQKDQLILVPPSRIKEAAGPN